MRCLKYYLRSLDLSTQESLREKESRLLAKIAEASGKAGVIDGDPLPAYGEITEDRIKELEAMLDEIVSFSEQQSP
jgi:Glu-tRNA(Gln) amidotransferase subunit E-like FAD-binding protein